MKPKTQTSDDGADHQGKVERDALAESEQRAAQTHPDNYKEEATDSKVVEIGPDLTDRPIEGIDPPPTRHG